MRSWFVVFSMSEKCDFFFLRFFCCRYLKFFFSKLAHAFVSWVSTSKFIYFSKLQVWFRVYHHISKVVICTNSTKTLYVLFETYLVMYFDVRKYGKTFNCCWDIQIKEGSQKKLAPQFTTSQSSWNENYGRYKQHFISAFFWEFLSFKFKKIATMKYFSNQSLWSLIIYSCFVNEIINDAAPAIKDLRFLHNSKVLIGCLRKINYIYFDYIPKL